MRLTTCGLELNALTSAFELRSITSTPTIQTTSPRSGTYHLQSTSVSATARYALWRFATANSTIVYIQVAVQFNALPGNATPTTFLNITGGTTMSGGIAALRIDNTGTVTARYRNSGVVTSSTTTPVSTGQWYVFEIMIDATGGSGGNTLFEFRKNGVTFATPTGAADATSITAQYLALGTNILAEAVGSTTIWYDDIIINNDTTSYNNTWPGSAKVGYMFATGSPTFAWQKTGGVAGDSTSYLQVSSPTDASTYLRSTTLNDQDWFDITSPGLAAGTVIDCVSLNAVRQKNDVVTSAANLAFIASLKVSGSQTDTSAMGPNSTTVINAPGYATDIVPYPLVLPNTPGGGAWSPQTLDDLQVGIKLSVDSSANFIQVMGFWVTYTYKAAPDPYYFAYF